jgi:hypothetical protein
LGAVIYSVAATAGAVSAPADPNFLLRIYEANPLAVLLLGAICLSMLVTGSGPMALDRALFRRKRTEQLGEAAE